MQLLDRIPKISLKWVVNLCFKISGVSTLPDLSVQFWRFSEVQSLNIIIIQSSYLLYGVGNYKNSSSMIFPQWQTSITIFFLKISLLQLKQLQLLIISLKLLSVRRQYAQFRNFSFNKLLLALQFPNMQVVQFGSFSLTIRFQYFLSLYLLVLVEDEAVGFRYFFYRDFLVGYCVDFRIESSYCFFQQRVKPNAINLLLMCPYYLRVILIIQQISLFISIIFTITMFKYLIINQYNTISQRQFQNPHIYIHIHILQIDQMSIRSSIRNIKNIFQDAVIRIPYFASTHHQTNTLAIVFDNEQQQNNQYQIQQINRVVQQQPGILGSQFKIYYNKDVGNKTLIILFQSVESAGRFYCKYAKNVDKLLVIGNSAENLVQNNRARFVAYFCKDITESGVNMQEILYNFGRVSVQIPQSLLIRNIIKQVAKHVFVEGIRGEQELLKCKNLVLPSSSSNLLDFMNPKILSSEAVYYRWRVYSYLQGDGDRNYRQQPYQMTIGGPVYYPPDQTCEKYNYRILTHQQRLFFTKLLQTLSSRKYHIEEAMAFCILNAGSTIEICCIIVICIIESCTKISHEDQNKNNRSSQVKHLISFFYLISDILFNSPSTIYRDIFTVLLPPVMQRLPKIPQLNSKISQLVQIWNKKFLFQDQFLRGLNISAKGELPSMQPLGMEQMTRTQHECYKQLINIETPEQIQQMCWKYGIAFSNQKIAQSLRNLSAVLAIDRRRKGEDQKEPKAGAYDGQQLTEKDLQKIKTKSCKVISCQDIPLKNLFEKDSKTSKSISYD